MHGTNDWTALPRGTLPKNSCLALRHISQLMFNNNGRVSVNANHFITHNLQKASEYLPFVADVRPGQLSKHQTQNTFKLVPDQRMRRPAAVTTYCMQAQSSCCSQVQSASSAPRSRSLTRLLRARWKYSSRYVQVQLASTVSAKWPTIIKESVLLSYSSKTSLHTHCLHCHCCGSPTRLTNTTEMFRITRLFISDPKTWHSFTDITHFLFLHTMSKKV